MENQTSTKTALKWGVILGIIFMILGTVTYVAELWKNSLFNIIGLLLIIFVIVLGIKEYKKNNNGFISFGQGINIGMLIAAISSIISGIFDFIYTSFIDTTIAGKVIDFTREKMLEDGRMTEKQIDDYIEMTQNFASPGIKFFFTILLLVIFGFLVSLIISAILRKDKPVFD